MGFESLELVVVGRLREMDFRLHGFVLWNECCICGLRLDSRLVLWIQLREVVYSLASRKLTTSFPSLFSALFTSQGQNDAIVCE